MSNRIAADFTPAQRAAFDQPLGELCASLPFLDDLSPEDRQEPAKLGDKSRAFATAALGAARPFTDVLPRSFDVEAFEEDVALFEAPEEPILALRDLPERLEDTRVQAGADAMDAARLVYHYVRGQGGSDALNETAALLGRRFAGQGRRAKPSGRSGDGATP